MKVIGNVVKNLRPIKNQIGLSLSVVPFSIIRKERQGKGYTSFINELYRSDLAPLQPFVSDFGTGSIILVGILLKI